VEGRPAGVSQNRTLCHCELSSAPVEMARIQCSLLFVGIVGVQVSKSHLGFLAVENFAKWWQSLESQNGKLHAKISLYTIYYHFLFHQLCPLDCVMDCMLSYMALCSNNFKNCSFNTLLTAILPC